ncbi:MAG: gliding motility-associated C-terminal domain-containing protein [Bacteroidia bacterium]
MKKNLLLIAFAFIIFGLKAQNNEILTESSISTALENARKNGTQEWEINRLNKGLHKRMQQQKAHLTMGASYRTIVTPPQINSNGCVNPGFEDGTINGWTLKSGDINLVNLPCNTCATTPGGISNVVNSTSSVTGQCTSGTDKYGGFPVVAPSLGSYSLLLNDASAGGKIMKAQYTFVVTPSTTLFSLKYAAVLQSGGSSHSPSQQPYFHVDATDVTLNSIVPCTQVDVTAPSSGAVPGWFVSTSDPSVSYRPWTPITLNLSTAIGHTVTINFTVSDCNQGGHFGYCYIDGDCSNPNNATSVSGFCGTTTGTVTMVAPPGYSTYQWYGPNPPYSTAISGGGGNTATLTTLAAIGDTFLVNTTSANGCNVPYKVVVKPSGIAVNTGSSSSCKGGSNGSVTTTVLGTGGNFNYAWTNSSGTAIGTTTTVANLPPGTYSVHVTDASNSCAPRDTTVTIASIRPVLQPTVAILCGTQVILSAGAGTNYTWYDATNAQTSVTTQTYNVVNGTNGQNYTATYIDASTSCLDSVKISLNQVNINFTPLVSPPCNGGNNGSLTFNASPNNSFSSYDWAVTGGTTGGATGVAAPISIPSLSQGTYTVVITAPSNTTCAYVYTGSLVNNALPAPKQDTVKICNQDILTLNPGVANSSHNWSGTNLPVSGGPYSTSPFVIQPPFNTTTAGYYNYTDSIHTNNGNCLSIYKVLVILKSFKTSIATLEKIKCYNGSNGKIKISVSEPTGPVNSPDTYVFTWSPGTYTSTATNLPATSTESNLHSGLYTCVVTNGNCVNTSTVNLVNVAPLRPDSFYGYYCPKDSLALLVADTGNTNYQWHNTNGTLVVNGANDSLKVPTQNLNNYYVTYKHAGCADSAVTMVAVTTYNAFRPNELVNIFSPNGDNRNDFFYPFYQTNMNQYQIFKQEQSYELKVYNRWGTLVYEATDYNKPWDGKAKSGSDADDGTYFFVVKYQSNCGSKADLIEKKGFVQLVR